MKSSPKTSGKIVSAKISFPRNEIGPPEGTYTELEVKEKIMPKWNTINPRFSFGFNLTSASVFPVNWVKNSLLEVKIKDKASKWDNFNENLHKIPQ